MAKISKEYTGFTHPVSQEKEERKKKLVENETNYCELEMT